MRFPCTKEKVSSPRFLSLAICLAFLVVLVVMGPSFADMKMLAGLLAVVWMVVLIDLIPAIAFDRKLAAREGVYHASGGNDVTVLQDGIVYEGKKIAFDSIKSAGAVEIGGLTYEIECEDPDCFSSSILLRFEDPAEKKLFTYDFLAKYRAHIFPDTNPFVGE